LFIITPTLRTRLKLPLHPVKHHTINAYGGAQIKLRRFLAYTLDATAALTQRGKDR